MEKSFANQTGETKNNNNQTPIEYEAGSASRPLLTEAQAAEYLNLPPSTLRKLRCTGSLPGGMRAIDFVKLGRLVRYRPEVLDAYIAESVVEASRV